MIEKREFHVVKCDSCGKNLSLGDEDSYTVFESSFSASECATSYDWSMAEDGTVICCDCVEEFKNE